MGVYEWVYVVVVLGGRGSGWSGHFYFVAFYFFSFIQSYPILQVETLNLSEPKEFSPRWFLQTDFITNTALILARSLLFSDNGSCCTMSFEVNFKASHVPLLALSPKYEADSKRCTEETAIYQEAPQEQFAWLWELEPWSQPLPASILWDSCGVQLGPCLGKSAEGTPVQSQAQRLSLGHFCTQILKAIKKCSSSLFCAHQQCLLDPFEGLRVKQKDRAGAAHTL